MISITLPDGSSREYEPGVSGADVAASIGPGLAKAALAIKLDGDMIDLATPIGADAAIEIITIKSPEALDLVRHDTAHVMAEAVKELYPETQITIGPNIEDGFFYDFARPTAFTPDDLENIEKRMHEIFKRNEPISREVWARDEAIAFFKGAGEHYKAEIIADLPEGETITLYRQGDFIDLCRGPHLPATDKVGKAFKLMKLAGAYWRGDSKNAMLQRIYGTAWTDEKDLAAHLNRIEEAERRDHRRLGREMDLFHFQEEAIGMVFWHPNGWTLYRELKNYMRRKLDAAGYVEVNTPQLVSRSLWEDSGHWDKFRENMFTVESDDHIHALKPMNCPCHVQIFRQGLTSYRDLPLRMAEFGACHRYEPSGALHGLMRVRGFVQDDAHIFCREDQIVEETSRFIDLARSVHADLGMETAYISLGTRPEVRAGTDEFWDKAETQMAEAARAAGTEPVVTEGDGAFYAPKLDFVVKDAIGREWTCGTIQLDYVLPERLGAEYVGEDGAKHRPVMLHRAILGSFERFIGIMIENYAGAFPLWLAPVQIVVATIVSDADDYAKQVAAKFKAAGLRVEIDLRNEKVGYKVREHSVAKVPVIAVVGKNEAEEGKVAIRRLGSQGQEIVSIEEAIRILTDEATPPDLKRG